MEEARVDQAVGLDLEPHVAELAAPAHASVQNADRNDDGIAGLRFDFREELDRMATLRAWPLAPWRIFLFVVLPQAMLVSILVAIAGHSGLFHFVAVKLVKMTRGDPRRLLPVVMAATVPRTLAG